MAMTAAPFTVILTAAAGVTALLAFYAYRFRRFAITPPIMGLLLANSVYALSYALELSRAGYQGMWFWLRISYLAIPAFPFFWILLAARTTGRERWGRASALVAPGLLSIATTIACWTNDLHHLYYRSVKVDPSGPFPVLAVQNGPLHLAFQVYSNAFFLLGILWLLRQFLETPRPHRRQTAILLAGSAVPWIVQLLFQAGVFSHRFDVNPFSLSAMCIIAAAALFRHGIIDIVPVARETILAGMRDGVIVVDDRNRICDFNPAAAGIFPALTAKLIGRGLEEAAAGQAALFDLLAGRLVNDTEISIDDARGRRQYIVRISEVRGRKHRPGAKVLLLSDATERLQLREMLRLQAVTDELTGTFNRRHFFERARLELVRAKRGGQPLSILILDLDHFKRVNDTRGHEAGDRVLRAVCDLFRARLRETDLVGRLGGEEFVILLPETPPARACDTAERLRASAAESDFPVSDEASARMTVSIGVAGTNRVSDETVEDLIRTADRAMYNAKNAGRNCVRCPPEPSS
jgi:diguanylate cyclase (GGDEF)-like protein